jgi:hypothetical protein
VPYNVNCLKSHMAGSLLKCVCIFFYGDLSLKWKIKGIARARNVSDGQSHETAACKIINVSAVCVLKKHGRDAILSDCAYCIKSDVINSVSLK